MKIKEMILTVAKEGGELLMKASSFAAANSMRVTAYQNRSKLESQKDKENIGIQVKKKDEIYYLRIYHREIDAAPVFTVNSQTGELMPLIEGETK